MGANEMCAGMYKHKLRVDMNQQQLMASMAKMDVHTACQPMRPSFSSVQNISCHETLTTSTAAFTTAIAKS